MHQLRQQLEELRGLFYEGPRDTTWWALCALFEQWSSFFEPSHLALAQTYATEQLNAWPQERRIAPTQWVIALAKGLAPPPQSAWDLVRAARFHPSEFEPPGWRRIPVYSRKHTRAFLNHPLASSLTHLSVGQVKLREIAALPYAQNLVHLEIHSAPITAEDFPAFQSEALCRGLRVLSLGSTTAYSAEVDVLQALADAAPLRDLEVLRMQSVRATDMGLLGGASHLQNLRELSLSKSHMGADGLRALLRPLAMSNLRKLDLQQNMLRTEGAQVFHSAHGLAQLEELQLNQNVLEPEGVEAILTAPPLQNLHTLSLGNSKLADEGASMVASFYPGGPATLGLLGNSITDRGACALADAPGLTHLDLRHNLLRGELLEPLFASDSLCVLNLSHNAFQDKTILSQHEKIGRVHTLQLQHCRVKNKIVTFLAQTPSLRNLRVLDLRHNQIRTPGANALGNSQTLTHLEALYLGYNKISDEGLSEMIRSANFTRLSVLDLSYNTLGYKSLRALIASPMVSQLRTLDLRGTNIGRRGAFLLANAPWSENLEALYINTDSIGERGVQHLVNSSHLSLSARANILGQNQGFDGESRTV